ncbi:MAG: hypothetical protein EA422_00070 [Gemmatimonadales bacterium]|nr:MAG: hypothetical protein EA422_00070 [Gemmatimonadales bacterium]
MFAPRGWHDSGGTFTSTGAIEDNQAAFDWLHEEEVVHRFGVDIQRISVGGYSFGASTVLAFAAQEPRVRRLFSIASTSSEQHDGDGRWVTGREGPLTALLSTCANT